MDTSFSFFPQQTTIYSAQDTPNDEPLENSSQNGQNPANTANTQAVTEFTRRKNWSQRIMEELRDFIYVVGPTGKFIYVSPSSFELFGYFPSDLVNRNITDFIHVDDIDLFVRDFNHAIQQRGRFSLFSRFRKSDDTFVILETNGHPHFDQLSDSPSPSSAVLSPTQLCKCFFMSARPYPTRNTLALDSFLELKIENERLKKKLREINEIKEANGGVPRLRESSATDERMPPPSLVSRSSAESSRSPSATLNAPTNVQQNITSMQSISPGNTLHDGLQQLDLQSHSMSQTPIDYNYQDLAMGPIELFTGLRYKEGERAHGISTGSESPALITGDGKIISLPQSTTTEQNGATTPNQATDGESPRKKNKKLKLAPDEYVCTDCGTTDSPEWRKGPMGAKTLCNACGLRFAKKQKKSQDSLVE